MRYLALSEVVELHRRLLETTGGAAGIRDLGALESALAANFSPGAVTPGSVSADDLRSDVEASSEYRAHLITVMARRAVEAAK